MSSSPNLFFQKPKENCGKNIDTKWRKFQILADPVKKKLQMMKKMTWLCSDKHLGQKCHWLPQHAIW